ncbi:MAG: hypothetical protein ACXWE6_06860 [Nitrososphaeraceae archaeon]
MDNYQLVFIIKIKPILIDGNPLNKTNVIEVICGFSLDPLKMRTPCNGDFFTPIIVNRGGHTDARC